MYTTKTQRKSQFCPIAAVLALIITAAGSLWAEPPRPLDGGDAVPDLYAPNLAGPGGFTTTTGGAPASALNPAQGGDSRRIVFDAGYLAVPGLGDEKGYIHAIEGGGLFPTRYGVFGGSLRYIGRPVDGGPAFESFPIDRTFGGNLFAAKEVYPGMSVGAGINFGMGAEWTLSGDAGFRYNTGSLGPLQNFTWAAVLRSMGKSYFPTWLTAAGGVSFDMLRIEGEGSKKDPFVLGASADLDFPSLFYPPYINMILKTGINMTIAELITLSFSWPGGSGLNARELAEHNVAFPAIPSVGLGVNFILPTGGSRVAGGRLPADGDLKINAAYKPLYEGVTAMGAGASWYVGMKDEKPPVIKTDYPDTMYFSPNHDGKADYLEFPVSITDDNYVAGWVMEIKDEQGNVVRTIRNKEQRPVSFSVKDFFARLVAVKKQVEVPSHFTWNGIDDSGELCPDGTYYFTITATDDSGNEAVSPSYKAVLKNTAPEIRIAAMSNVQRIFNPKGGGGEKNTVTFSLNGSEEDAWMGGIWNAEDQQIRAFEPISGKPQQQVWDGRDDSGEFAHDGVYSYRISATDRAMNSASAVMQNIILDARETGAFVTSSESYIAPKPNQSTGLVDFEIRLSLQDGIESWQLELKDESGTACKTFPGTDRVPANVSWNGLDDRGAIREGKFIPELTIRYTKGDVITAKATAVMVDVTGPVLSFGATPEFFSPDDDGVDDELFISLSAQDESPIAVWKLEIRDPESNQVFYRAEGKGSPTPRLVWNGRSNIGARNELVQSATDYPYTFSAEDILGNASVTDGKIGVDVLVIRDGDKLRIQIPSIVFRPNFADFKDLPKETVDNNARILRRIAQILNKFKDYKVQVEGHANPTTPPGASRDREEIELMRLSEARAKAVVDELVRYNVARARLSSTGAGGSRTVVPWDDIDNRWKNRRVEFILIK